MSTNSTRKALAAGSILSAGVLLVAALVGLLNYFGMKYYKRFDWTGSKLYSLSDKSKSVLAGLDKQIDVTLFLPPSSPLHDPSRELLERYAAASPKISFRAIEADKNLIEAQRLVEKYQLSSLNVVVFEAGDDRRVVEEGDLADYDYSGMQYGQAPQMTGFKGEEAFTGAILELAESRKPKVLLTSGHGEASIDEVGPEGLSQVRDLLGKENLALESWASLGKPEVPEGTDLLVIAGARAAFVAPELDAFGRYLDRGGRMLVLLDPELAGAAPGGVKKSGLEAWLATRGVDVRDDIVVDPSATVPMYGAETLFVNATGSQEIVRSLEQANYPVIVALARSVAPGNAPEGMEATTLLATSSDGWGETDLANLRGVARDDKDSPAPVPLAVAVAKKSNDGAPAMDDEDLETATPPPPAAEGPTWRLVVIGDSDFATNSLLPSAGNPTLVANAFNWLLERQKLLEIGAKKPEQVRLSMTPGELRSVTWGVLAGLPALAVAAGVLVWYRRRRVR
ncbi:MAG: GldG family protein [Thermoanaerobaculia bacterium]